ncbi:MAG: hypothetical protein M3Y86_13185 [Verrucomicrobiota bacterium]|nr:hypothetical protein [Verrucomicrobiota bacterium]
MMLASDKCPAREARPARTLRKSAALLGLLAVAICVASCNRMATPPAKQVLKDAEAKANSGDMLEAISLYERALDGSAASAEVHYRLALLYDDKMNDPLNALHHFKRYLTLTPEGAHAAEVKGYMKRDELTLVTTLSGDAVVSHGEAARLTNENLSLHRQLEEKTAQMKAAANTEKAAAHPARAKKVVPPKASKSGRRARVVRNQ